MATLKIKQGDTVQMLSGKDRGKQGRVLEARPRDNKVLVENLNLMKRHQKPRPMRDVSNVMLVCPTCKLPTRIGYRFKQGKGGEQIKVRVCKREGCGQEIDK